MTLRLRIAILILLVIPPVIHACLANQNDEITQLARLSIAVRKYMPNCSLSRDNTLTLVVLMSSVELYLCTFKCITYFRRERVWFVGFYSNHEVCVSHWLCSVAHDLAKEQRKNFGDEIASWMRQAKRKVSMYCIHRTCVTSSDYIYMCLAHMCDSRIRN